MLTHLELWVAQEAVRQAVLVLPVELRFRLVCGHAEHLVACVLKFRVLVLEAACLLGAAARVGLGVEEQHHSAVLHDILRTESA